MWRYLNSAEGASLVHVFLWRPAKVTAVTHTAKRGKQTDTVSTLSTLYILLLIMSQMLIALFRMAFKVKGHIYLDIKYQLSANSAISSTNLGHSSKQIHTPGAVCVIYHSSAVKVVQWPGAISGQ